MLQQIEQIVDELLLKRGSYEPLLLLQQTRVLNYRHYNAWRTARNQDKCLDAVLSGKQEEILEILKQAAHYANELQLEPIKINYTGWEDAAYSITLAKP